jgi:dephospho-CoA kinase
MLKFKKVAVTGSLSAGKTTVCQIFKELGAYVVSADEIVHQLLSPGTTITQQVADLIGSDISNGSELDRKKIAAKVFAHPELLYALEKILHPAVFDEIERRYQQACQEKKYPLFIAEIPLLYETEKEGSFDKVISVTADPDLCYHRFTQAGSHHAEEFEQRMHRQLAPAYKMAKAHYKIENNGTLEQLKKSVQILYTKLTKDFN